MKHPKTYRDKQVIILGLARSGVAVAKLFREQGAQVTVNDIKERNQCPEADDLEALGISVVCGEHPDDLIDRETALVVKNPGIPYSAPPVRQALENGVEVVTEVEVAYHICEAPIIGITGSNGKTTTTTLVGKILEEAGLKPIVAGNIGRSLCDAARDAESSNRMVVELSSFQLKGTVSFRPKIAALLNIYETHMDYHGTLEDYAGSKAKLFANQTPEDTAVLNADDEFCRNLAKKVPGKVMLFSILQELDYGVCLHNETIVIRDETGRTIPVIPANEMGIPGRHNVQNALAAAAISWSAGASPEAIAKVLREFRGVEHRLEFIRELNGVTYINGSKATNPAATIKDLESFKRPVVLIAGGQERKMEYTDLIPYFRHKLHAIVTLGETREKLNRAAEEAGVLVIRTVEDGESAAAILRQAVALAHEAAREGDVVLLSPACASWDMFSSYEDRGRIFKETVHTLN